MGWDNAAFWVSQVGTHALYPRVLEGGGKLAAGDTALEAHVKTNCAAWQPLLCRDSEGSEGIAEARCFCQAMMNLEWRLLLEHSWALS